LCFKTAIQRTTVLAIVAFGLAGCAHTHPVKAANPRPVWWQLYRHGIEHMQRGEIQAAAAYFEQVLGFQPGSIISTPADTSRARTYGLHFIECFPRRELGICYFYLGNYDLAKHYLVMSVNQTFSARTEEYLNKLSDLRGRAEEFSHGVDDKTSGTKQ